MLDHGSSLTRCMSWAVDSLRDNGTLARLQQRWLEMHLGQGVASPTHWLPSTQGFVDATLVGMGWALNPAMLVQEALDRGLLVELIPGAVLDVPLYWQVNRLAAERLGPLTRSIVMAARHALV